MDNENHKNKGTTLLNLYCVGNCRRGLSFNFNGFILVVDLHHEDCFYF